MKLFLYHDLKNLFNCKINKKNNTLVHFLYLLYKNVHESLNTNITRNFLWCFMFKLSVKIEKKIKFDYKSCHINFYSFFDNLLEAGNVLNFEKLILDILFNFRKIQYLYIPLTHVMKVQTEINKNMRKILIDWIIDVHHKFKLLNKTLFLTINIIDRFLCLKKISKQKLQLLGITSMFIASKYEEIYAPEIRDFIYICDNAYSKEDIIKMEHLICYVLRYKFNLPSPQSFLSLWMKILCLKLDSIFFSNKCLELCLIEINTLKYNFEIISLSCIFLSLKFSENFSLKILMNIFRIDSKKNFSLVKSSGLIASLLLLYQSNYCGLNHLHFKYSSNKHKEFISRRFHICF